MKPMQEGADSFFNLTPDAVLDAVESAIGAAASGVRATGRATALNSIENRVYEIELDDKSSVVAKFYRPARWTVEQILEEHRFMLALDRAEVPVVPPKALVPGKHVAWTSGMDQASKDVPTLARMQNQILFAVFPKVQGRSLDELRENHLQVLGRFLARLHSVGEGIGGSSKRLHLNVETYGYEPLELLERSGHLTGGMGDRYLQIAHEVCGMVEPLLEGVAVQRIHGDCHLGNLLWLVDQPLFVDFDDMLIGPPVQDIWMIVGGRDEFAKKDRETLLTAYEEMREFDWSSLALVEPLRAMRLIHYSGWIARRWNDPSFPRMFPHFGGERWWQEEIEALLDVKTQIEERAQRD